MSKYFTMKELNPHNFTLTGDQEKNLVFLTEGLDKIREALDKPMIITSGVRDIGLQMRVNPLNPGSNHLRGLAVDVHDEGGILTKWILDNLSLIKEVGFWFEDFRWTHHKVNNSGWCHFQCIPPKSGKRIFVPNSSPAEYLEFWDGEYNKIYDGV